MRLAFAGTPEFSRLTLAALAAAGHEITLVLTQPDRPAGRGMKLQPSPVKQWALDAGLPVLQPRSLRLDGRWQPTTHRRRARRCEAAAPDALVVAAYGLILPRWTLDLPPPWLPQRACLAAAALARCGADPACHRGGRRRRPASRSCRWTPASTPAACCSREALPIARRRHRGEPAR